MRKDPRKEIFVMGSHNESIVLVGGGGGVYRVARSLKHIRWNISTVQTTFDHGNHSGQLRDERGVLPPGDIRQAILALSDDAVEGTLRQLLSFRFSEKGTSSLNNATVGNILLTALEEITGSLPIAISTLCSWYGVKGKVLPVSLDHADLWVRLSDGSELGGEGNIDSRSLKDERTILSAFLRPKAHLYIGAREALVGADKIVFCPGDLFTSVIPNTLVEGFAEAVQESRAKRVCVVNLMTKKTETHKFPASRFVRTILEAIGVDNFDTVICNDPSTISRSVRKQYKSEYAEPVRIDHDALLQYTKSVLSAPLAEEAGSIVRHSSRLAGMIASL
jgi:uncharacterized cofD-like protein